MMATSISSASSSFLILQPLKPPKHSRLSKAKTLTSTIKATSSQPKPNNANARKPTPRNRRRSSYGSSRRSALKKTFAQEQVTFTAPVSSDPHVGIIGGGMAGLACALSLDKRGVKSTVFDTVCHLSCFLAFFFCTFVFFIGELEVGGQFNYLFNMVRLCLYLRVYACIMVM